MPFLDQIVSWLSDCADYFYSACVTATGWVWPFNALATPMYSLYVAFFYLAQYFGQFNSWLDWAAGRIAVILSYDNIGSYFKWWFDAAANAWSWVYNAAANVLSVVNTWWSARLLDVQGLISAATQGFASLVADWVEFRDYTLPRLISWTWLQDWWDGTIVTWWNARLLDVQNLINTAFLNRDSWWNGWQEQRDNVVTFFTDPLTFLTKRLEDWFWHTEGK